MAKTHLSGEVVSENGFNIGTNLSNKNVIDSNGAVYGRKTIALNLAGTADTGGGVLAWANPEDGDIVITRVVANITKKSTAASTINIGTTATNATTSSDNLIDGLDAGTDTITADNFDNAGTNGKSLQKLATGKWITVSRASGAVAGLEGKLYVDYIVV